MILLVGGRGSIGRRYATILKHLNIPFRICDLGDSDSLVGVKKAIIASPTETHFYWCQKLGEAKIPFLCEKPLSKNVEDTERLMHKCVAYGYVVNNYAYVTRSNGNLDWNFYNSGRDGLLWDVCQLVLLASLNKVSLLVKTESPVWNFYNGSRRVDYREIEDSYCEMIRDFASNNIEHLWGMVRAHQMTLEVSKLQKRTRGEDIAGFNWNPSTDEFEAFPKKDL